eukprot:TRINITY_DN2273_c0_g2_i1.p1 TRINITY_DN2273_c0_g2~~TRINITY_DN2273_c0_g2_i1.p1  ORF type:complete len:152 (+),score=11.38 TRINITY_DN2273_c0_g2_i1:179-634(+)
MKEQFIHIRCPFDDSLTVSRLKGVCFRQTRHLSLITHERPSNTSTFLLVLFRKYDPGPSHGLALRVLSANLSFADQTTFGDSSLVLAYGTYSLIRLDATLQKNILSYFPVYQYTPVYQYEVTLMSTLPLSFYAGDFVPLSNVGPDYLYAMR